MKDLLESYLLEEPDSQYRQEIKNLDPSQLADRLEGQWRFGTAGFRAKMEAGYLRLNRVSVAKIAYALGKYLKTGSKVVIGYDGRHHSQEYALLVAQVLDALGHESILFSKLVPTPICAFSVTELKADAGLMVTASHNPPKDNGIKIYGPDGAQLVAPTTHAIEAILDQAPGYPEIKLSSKAPQRVPESVIDAYFGNLTVSAGKPISIIYTPMHGVGEYYAVRALRQAGFENVHVVPSQAKPDGDFPTVQFPNPEEPGALDKAIELAQQTQAELILANDPDADRLAVCIGTQALTGNEIGVLLGNYLIENHHGKKKPLVMSTIVSSRMLSKIASVKQVSYAETLTGFANIAHTALEREKQFGEEFIFGYEEALGYCVGNRVRDKDGISAAVLFAKLFSELKSQHKTVWQKLAQLSETYGLYRNLAWSLRGDLKLILERAQNLKGFEKQISPAPGLLLYTGEHDLRLIIRPSGTEPKVKFYAEVIGQPSQQKELDQFLAQVQGQINV